jgi:hypothetical protein
MHDPHVSDKWPEWRETIKVSAIQAKPGFQAQGISGPQPAGKGKNQGTEHRSAMNRSSNNIFSGLSEELIGIAVIRCN